MAFSSLRRFRSIFPKPLASLPTALLVGAALIASGCHPKVTDPNDPKFVVAEKGNWQVLNEELDKQVNTYMQQSHVTADQIGKEKMPMLKTAMLDNIVLKKILLDKAAAMNLDKKDLDKQEAAALDQVKGPLSDAELQEKIKGAGMTLDELKQRIHEKILITKVLDAEAFKNVEPTEQEIDDIYLKNKDHFVIPAKVRASRILILVDDKTSPADKAAKKKAIDKAHDRVVKGEDFGKVATEVSEDKYSAPKGGDIGFFQKNENESANFDDVAFSTKVGTVSAVFQTPLGYQFIKVTATQPAGDVPIAEARSFIAGKLRDMKKGEAQEKYSKKLIADSGVTYHLVRVDLPPNPPMPGAPPNAAADQQAPPAPETAPAPPSTNAMPAK